MFFNLEEAFYTVHVYRERVEQEFVLKAECATEYSLHMEKMQFTELSAAQLKIEEVEYNLKQNKHSRSEFDKKRPQRIGVAGGGAGGADAPPHKFCWCTNFCHQI